MPHPILPLYPYQRRWIEDRARFKLAVKAAQIGYSFAAALEAVLDCLEQPTVWIVLSRGERQSAEFMQKVLQHVEALRVAAATLETEFFEQTRLRQLAVRFPNGSRILGLPANPDTARGYTGNLILDEFAFHQHDREIWAAAFGRVSRGELKLRVLSTPNGQRGKFYELAKECGLAEGPAFGNRGARPPIGAPRLEKSAAGNAAFPGSPGANPDIWSGHWCDVHRAVAEGCPINIAAVRRAIGDEMAWQQEYECVFLAERDHYLPLELILSCEDPQASVALPQGWEEPGGGEYSLGYDVARVGDLSVAAVVERLGDVHWVRGLIEMRGLKFSDQEKILAGLLPRCRRAAVDATGLGREMAERLAARFPGRVEPLHFTAGRKQEMAARLKRHLEERTLRLPEYAPLRRDLHAVKRLVTAAGTVRFDAEHTEQGHADRFWALGLALAAAERPEREIASGAVEAAENEILGQRQESFAALRGVLDFAWRDMRGAPERGSLWD